MFECTLYTKVMLTKCTTQWYYISTRCFKKKKKKMCYLWTHLATPFCNITLPLCKWPCDGKPRSRKNNNASKICRPSRCTCEMGKQVDFFVYFRHHDSFHCDCSKESIQLIFFNVNKF